ncbi:hypothetical protein K0M31_014745 [Melipona bicolor]|uniref:Uncharacterized protein n=1 Tax=Melipona bicolor TaxID=60889 RepID=A0AA40FGS4_9HYME|nr:hypothetical protein K0M31_014745 [Melipona bicolor]
MRSSVPIKHLFTSTFDISVSLQRSDQLESLRSSWRTWMGADSSDSVVSIGWHRSCGHGDASSLSEVSTKIETNETLTRITLIKSGTVRSHGDEA